MYKLQKNVQSQAAKDWVHLFVTTIAGIVRRSMNGIAVTCMAWVFTLLIWRKNHIDMSPSPNVASQGLDPTV